MNMHADEMQRERTWGGLKRTSCAELLEWHSTDAGDMPDAETTVLMWVIATDGCIDWCVGWWTGDEWLDASSGSRVAGRITHWAQPDGPAA